jgi:threonylcarbamoyladenosine tRNA methylthiotransferase MtaB
LPGKVAHADKVSRSKALIALSESKAADFIKENTGLMTDVLFERSHSGGMITGFSSNYIRVEYPWQSRLAGQIIKVKLNGASSSGKMSVDLIE